VIHFQNQTVYRSAFGASTMHDSCPHVDDTDCMDEQGQPTRNPDDCLDDPPVGHDDTYTAQVPGGDDEYSGGHSEQSGGDYGIQTKTFCMVQDHYEWRPDLQKVVWTGFTFLYCWQE
jgi:hypothetical protein